MTEYRITLTGGYRTRQEADGASAAYVGCGYTVSTVTLRPTGLFGFYATYTNDPY